MGLPDVVEVVLTEALAAAEVLASRVTTAVGDVVAEEEPIAVTEGEGEPRPLGLEERVVRGVPPVRQALVLTLQLRVAAGEEEMLGEGVALAEWLREAAPLADLGGVAETLALVRTVAVGSGVREGEGVTV
jgi:hypothetical protein